MAKGLRVLIQENNFLEFEQVRKFEKAESTQTTKRKADEIRKSSEYAIQQKTSSRRIVGAKRKQ